MMTVGQMETMMAVLMAAKLDLMKVVRTAG